MKMKISKSSMRIAVLAVVCIVLGGCGDEKKRPQASAEVRYMTIAKEKVTLTRELPGRVTALQISEVRPQVGGIIKERLFEEGADVVEGQVLYQIDPAIYEAAYNSAKAELARANANLASARLLAQRYAKIVKTNAISKQDYDDAAAAHQYAVAAAEAARQAVATAEINLGYTKVTAPVSGRIGRSFVTPGALATQNQASPLATIQQLGQVYVDITQPSTELLRLQRALTAGRLRSSGPDSAKARLLLEDGSPYASNFDAVENGDQPQWIEGTLLFSDVTIDQSTGSVTLRATFDNPGKLLLPGMYVRAVLEEGVSENAVLVPQKSVMRDTRGKPFVYVLTKEPIPVAAQSGTAVNEPVTLEGEEYFVARRTIEIDRSHNNDWLVTSGLDIGDKLLVDGLQKVRPGAVAVATRFDSDTFAEKDLQGSQTPPLPEQKG